MERNHKRGSSKPRMSATHIYIALALIVLVAAALAYILSAGAIHSKSGPGAALAHTDAISVGNLNTSDVIAILPGSDYVAVMQGNTSTFIPQLQDEGYIGASASLFELKNQKQYNGTRFPAIIMSDVMVMSNETMANQSLGNMFFSNNANQTDSDFTYQLQYPNGSVRGIPIYMIYSAAVFNSTIARMLNISNTHMPDFQYASIFEYNNTIDAVYSNGYVESQNFSNVSNELAERLLEKLAAS